MNSWQFRYRHDGRPQRQRLANSRITRLGMGTEAADEARNKATTGEHLTQVKAVAKATKGAPAQNTFEAVAADWVARETRMLAHLRLPRQVEASLLTT